MPAYLADTTIWIWAKRDRTTREKLADRVDVGEVTTCVPVSLEYLHGARNGAEYEEDLADMTHFPMLLLSPRGADRALEVQRALAHTTHGAHRIPAVDYLVAAIAEDAGATLWHFDRDLARLCDFTGQPHEYERVSRRAR